MVHFESEEILYTLYWVIKARSKLTETRRNNKATLPPYLYIQW